MMPLTLKYCKENDLTIYDMVKYFRLEWNEKQCSDYLFYNFGCTFEIEYVIDTLNKNLLPRKLIFLRHQRIILAKHIENNSNFNKAQSVKRFQYLKLIQAFKNNLKQLL